MDRSNDNTPNQLKRPQSKGRMLGYSAEQRGSELQAGARAILLPSPLTYALSSTVGRALAKLFQRFVATPPLINYAAFRPVAMKEVIKRALPDHVEQPKIMDPFTAYTPSYIWLAQEMPHILVYETDLPPVIDDIQKRLHRAKDFKIPPNVHFRPVDWAQESLDAALGDERLDVFITIGAYVNHEIFIQNLRMISDYLSIHGAVISAFPWMPGVAEMAKVSRMFRMQVGEYPGGVETEESIHQIFAQADFYDVEIYHLPKLAQELHMAEPAALEIIVRARH